MKSNLRTLVFLTAAAAFRSRKKKQRKKKTTEKKNKKKKQRFNSIEENIIDAEILRLCEKGVLEENYSLQRGIYIPNIH